MAAAAAPLAGRDEEEVLVAGSVKVRVLSSPVVGDSMEGRGCAVEEEVGRGTEAACKMRRDFEAKNKNTENMDRAGEQLMVNETNKKWQFRLCCFRR
jgi:hypothetical protein